MSDAPQCPSLSLEDLHRIDDDIEELTKGLDDAASACATAGLTAALNRMDAEGKVSRMNSGGKA